MLRSSFPWRDRLTLWTGAILLAPIVAVGILGLTQLINLIRSANPQVDFGTYYLAGAILDSSDPDELYSMGRLEREAAKRGMSHVVEAGRTGPYLYPPFLAVLMRPVSRMSYSLAETGWLWFNLFMILLSIPPLVMWNARQRPGIGMWLAILLTVVLYTPGHSALVIGQITPLELFALSWVFGLLVNKTLAKHRAAQIVAGWLIGLASIIKLFPILLIVLLLWKRQFRVVGWTILSLGVYLLIGVLGGGLSNTVHFFVSFLPSFYGESVYHSLLNNQSFSATLVRWLGPGSLIPYLSLAYTGVILGTTCLGLVHSRRARQDDERLALEFALVLTSSILTLTHIALHYYLLLLIPMSALWFSPGTSSRLRVVSVLGSMALICAHTISMASLVFEGLGRALPFGLMAVLSIWGGLVARVGWAAQPCALEVQR